MPEHDTTSNDPKAATISPAPRRRRPTWVPLEIDAAAACRSDDPELFFPATPQGVQAARQRCAGCPLVVACREWGLHHEAYGIWGGTTARDRKRLRRDLGIKLRTPTVALPIERRHQPAA